MEAAIWLTWSPIWLNASRQSTLAAEPSVQLDLESGTICRLTSDSRTCHTAVLDSRFNLVSVTKAQRESARVAVLYKFSYLLN